VRNTSASNGNDPKSASVSCATGDRVLGGGADSGNGDIYIATSAPVTTGAGTSFAGGTSFANATGWTATAGEDSGAVTGTWSFSVWVVCADTTAGGGPPGP
jgi:hypothetical protein